MRVVKPHKAAAPAATIPEAGEVAPLVPGGRVDEIAPLHGDGSARRFFRVRAGEERHILLVGPDPAENAAYVRVARHLAARGVRVPAIYGVNETRGWILMEDVGDASLFHALSDARGPDEMEVLYAPVFDLLCKMQVEGARGFSLAVGFADAPYGRRLMIVCEGGYFLREFALGMTGIESTPEAVRDIERLAGEAGRAPGGYFLHRDFQSRNLHRAADGWAILDFQGARPGPLGYDAAALILDPYAAHPAAVRGRLFDAYLDRLRERPGVDAAAVRESFFALGAMRLMQALGAYGKLGGRLGKPGFLEHASAALAALEETLSARRADYPALADIVARVREAWTQRVPPASS